MYPSSSKAAKVPNPEFTEIPKEMEIDWATEGNEEEEEEVTLELTEEALQFFAAAEERRQRILFKF